MFTLTLDFTEEYLDFDILICELLITLQPSYVPCLLMFKRAHETSNLFSFPVHIGPILVSWLTIMSSSITSTVLYSDVCLKSERHPKYL